MVLGTVLRVPVSCLVEPSSNRLLRVADRGHIEALKDEMLKTRIKTSCLIGYIPKIKADEVLLTDVEEGKYKVETLAGNHRRIALQEITTEKLSPFHERWPVILYVGLNEQQALRLSYEENKMSSNSKPTTFQDEVCLFRERLKLFTELPTSGVPNITRKIKENWLPDICAITGYKVSCYLFIWGFTSLSTLYRSYHDE